MHRDLIVGNNLTINVFLEFFFGKIDGRECCLHISTFFLQIHQEIVELFKSLKLYIERFLNFNSDNLITFLSQYLIHIML